MYMPYDFFCVHSTQDHYLLLLQSDPQINLNQRLGGTLNSYRISAYFFNLCMFTSDRRFSMFPSPTKVIKMRDCFLLPHLQEEILQLG